MNQGGLNLFWALGSRDGLAKELADGVNSLRGPDRSFVVVTHYQRLLDYIVPDYVHVLAGGRIVKSGDKSLALELEKAGYGWIETAPVAAEAGI